MCSAVNPGNCLSLPGFISRSSRDGERRTARDFIKKMNITKEETASRSPTVPELVRQLNVRLVPRLDD